MWDHKKSLKILTCWDVSGSSLGSCCPNGLSKFASPNFNLLGQDPLFPKQRGQIITAPLTKANRGVTAQIVSWRPPERGEPLNCRPFECRSLQRHKEILTRMFRMPTSENPHNRGNKNRKRPKYHFVKTYACETTRFTNYGIRSLFMNFSVHKIQQEVGFRAWLENSVQLISTWRTLLLMLVRKL